MSRAVPGNHFVALGGGRKLGALVQTSIKRPPFFFYDAKRGAYDRASMVDQLHLHNNFNS